MKKILAAALSVGLLGTALNAQAFDRCILTGSSEIYLPVPVPVPLLLIAFESEMALLPLSSSS